MSCVRCLLPCLLALLCARIALSAVAMEEELVAPVRLDGAPEDGKVLYRLDVFGQALTLELEADPSFLSKDFSLQFVGRPNIPTGEETEEVTGNLADCFYSGTVNGEPASSAALSLCSGIRGAFYYRGEEYFIQPSNHTITPASPKSDTPLLLHLVSKRSRAKAKCGVTDGTPQQLDSEEPPKILTPPGTAPYTTNRICTLHHHLHTHPAPHHHQYAHPPGIAPYTTNKILTLHQDPHSSKYCTLHHQ